MRVLVLVAAGLLLAAASATAAGNYGFKVQVTLSPKAAALLTQKHESITVSAMYEGFPTPAGKKHADDMGQVGLGDENVTIPGTNGTALITGSKVDAKALPWVIKPQVLINVVSARHSDPDNLLDCGIFEDDVTKAQARPIQIACKVIGEP
jgi:hypothetical protein